MKSYIAELDASGHQDATFHRRFFSFFYIHTPIARGPIYVFSFLDACVAISTVQKFSWYLSCFMAEEDSAAVTWAFIVQQPRRPVGIIFSRDPALIFVGKLPGCHHFSSRVQ